MFKDGFKKWVSRWLSKSSKALKSPLDNVSNHFYHGEYRACISSAEALFEDANQDLQWAAKRFAGLANYRLKRFDQSTRLFESIAEHSKNTDDWFNLMNSAIRNGEIELGESAYSNFNSEKSSKGQNHMLTYANVTYQLMMAYQDVGEYQKALEKLIVLKRYISQVNQHNSDYLAKYGIPFIYQTLIAGRVCLEHEYTPEQIDRFLTDFENHVDQDGKDSIQEFRMTLKPKV